MKNNIKSLTVGVLALATSAAYAVDLNIVNHSFEDPALGSGSFFYSPTPVPGWTATATGGADRGIWNTAASGKDGLNIAFVYGVNAIAQDLTHAILADTTYTVTYLVGRPGGGNFNSNVELWAGGSVANGAVTGGTRIANQTVVVPGIGDMIEHSFTFTSPNSGGVVGQNLALRFTGPDNSGSYVSYDNFRISTEAVPEPASMTVLGLAAIAAYRKKRKA
ncbi:hypothetical protein C0431_00575 [bacterium]|jgi:hypothetical protein|nr:hypothetical protein [bacterium]